MPKLLPGLEDQLQRAPRWVPFLVLMLATFIVWGRSLLASFVWDDQLYIVLNEALRSPSQWLRYFTDAEVQKAMAPYPYRALRTLHYGILTWMTGQPAPWLFHLANLLWHAAASLAVYALSLRIFTWSASRSKGGAAYLTALFAALAFCVHPVAAEVVCWAKSLDDLMGTTFLLLAFIASWDAWSASGRVRWASCLASLAGYALALWSKESVVGMLFLFLFPAVIFRPIPRKVFRVWFGMLCLIQVVFLAVRHMVLQYLSQVSVPLSGTYARTLFDMIPVTLRYAKSFLGIPPFHPDYSFMEGGFRWVSPAIIAGVAVAVLYAAIGFWAFARPRDRLPAAFGMAWIPLALLPVSNAIPMMQYFAERFVYLPLVGFVIILGGLFAGAAARTRFALPIAAGLLAAWAGCGLFAGSKWQSEMALWRYAADHAPRLSSRIALNRVSALSEAGLKDEVDAYMAEHSDLLRERPKGRWLMAQRTWEHGDRTNGLALMRGLEAEMKEDPRFLVNLGVCLATAGEREAALLRFQQASARWPSQISAWENLGLCLSEMGRYAQAREALLRAAALDPDRVNIWRSLSAAAWQARDWPAAEEAFSRLVQREPGNPENAYWLERVRTESKAATPGEAGTPGR